MKKDIAKLLDHLGGVAFLYRLDEFIALFEKQVCQRFASLLLVPWAAVRSEKVVTICTTPS